MAEDYVNDPDIEAVWAIRAYESAETHFNILRSVDPQDLKLTAGHDDQIYAAFRQKFSSLRIDLINEDELKSEASKRDWRSFCELVKEWIDDYDFGTLLRLNTLGAYDSENTILVPRFQFLTIEIARNREGFNVAVREKFRNLLENTDISTETKR